MGLWRGKEERAGVGVSLSEVSPDATEEAPSVALKRLQ
jgi:hypothetical protein